MSQPPSPTQPSAQTEFDLEEEEDEIPPAIACAHCGQVTCDGCRPRSSGARPQADLRSDPSLLPWEQDTQSGYFRRLVLTSYLTAVAEQSCFTSKRAGSFFRALHFACMAETLAVLSFALPWALGFAVFFPAISWELARSGEALTLCALILSGLVVLVVALHLLWGAALEWSLKVYGTRADYRLGLRFGLYACGWDLLASPAGLLLLWLFEGKAFVWRGLRNARMIARIALSTYLNDARGLAPELHRRAIALCFTIISFVFLGLVFFGLTYLVYQLLY